MYLIFHFFFIFLLGSMGIYGPSVRQIIGEIMRLGPLGTFRKIYYMNILKVGTLVGVDQFGNQ